MKTSAHFLSSLSEHAESASGLRRDDIRSGDVLLLYTQNSLYSARSLRDGRFAVSGGWYDQHYELEFVTSIVGCTWGGKCIHQAMVASPGMRIEFGNRVLTSILQKVVHIPARLMN